MFLPNANDQTVIYIEGPVTLDTYQRAYRDEKSRIDKKIVFVFPGNPGHHTAGNTMFTIKNGKGLAVPAEAIGRAGFPVLSMPTTGMDGWVDQERNQYKILSNQAIADLYKAIAEGYSLMIPVRRHANTTYFDAPLRTPPQKEPSFWGGVQRTANKPLANEYTFHLNNLEMFTSILRSEGDEAALASLRTQSPYFAQVYVAARALSTPVLASVPTTAPATSTMLKGQEALESHLTILKEKADLLRKNGNDVAADAANVLHGKITASAKQFFNHAIRESVFKSQCTQAVDEARPALEKFGLKEILSNLVLAILGLGVVYLAACVINKAATGNFLFFRTDASKALDALEEEVGWFKSSEHSPCFS